MFWLICLIRSWDKIDNFLFGFRSILKFDCFEKDILGLKQLN